MPKLAIDVEAKFAEVMDGFDKLGKKADQQAKQMSTAFKAAGTVLAGIFSVALVKQQFDLFRGTLEQLASLDDAAAQAGTSVEKFSEAWLFLRPTGVAVEDLSGVVEALFKALGKGGKEGEEVTKALAEVGVSAKDAAGNIRDPIVVLEEFAKGLDKFETSGNKTALIYEVLGRSAGKYIPLLEDLAKKQGESASITTELASKSEELANQFRAIEQIGDNLRMNFFAAYIDDIKELTEKYLAASKAGAGFIEMLLNSAAPGFREGVVKKSLSEFQGTLKELESLPIEKTIDEKILEAIGGKSRDDKIREAKDAIADYTRQLDALNKMKAVTQKFDSQLKSQEDRGFEPTGTKGQIGARPKDEEKKKKVAKERETEAEKLTKWLESQVQKTQDLNLLEQTALKILQAKEEKNHGITDQMEDRLLATAREVVEAEKLKKLTEEQAELDATISQAAQRDVERIKQLADSYRDLIDPVEQYRAKLREITELEEGGVLDSGEAGMAREKILEQLAGLDETKEAITEIDEYAKNAAESMQEAFADFLFDPFKDGVEGMAKNFAKTVQRMAADAVAAQLMKSLFGDFAKSGSIGGILGGLFLDSAGGTSTNTTESTLRALEGGSDAVYSGAETKSEGVSIQQTFHVSAGASKADMTRAAREGKDQAVAEIMAMQRRR